ncbi:MAG TPA: hypothetical protein PK093_24865 [Phycisphaerae bacterium]|nr:hypothetical protein [Phycisphaerae bacterium]
MIASKLCALLIGLISVGAPADRPPELTFDKHVDYVGWWYAQLDRRGSENAFELYQRLVPDRDGHGGMPNPEGDADRDRKRMTGGVWSASEFPAYSAYLDQCEPYLAALEQAAHIKHHWDPNPPEVPAMIEILLPELTPVRAATKALTARAWRAQERQDEAILSAVRTQFRVADHMQQRGMTVAALVGIAIRFHGYDTALAGVQKDVIKGKQIQRLYDTLRQYDPGPGDWPMLVNCEWAVALDSIQYACTKLDADRSKMAESPLKPGQAVALFEKRFAALRRIADEPLDAKSIENTRSVDAMDLTSIDTLAFRKLAFSLTRARELAVRLESVRRGVMITLALYAHHEKHGEWPKRLKDLDKELGLKDYRDYGKDPYTGKLFRYRLVDGKPLLYSIGADGVDDGGRHDSHWGEKDGGDFVFVPLQK